MKKYEEVSVEIKVFAMQDMIRMSEEANYVDDPYHGENDWWKTN